MERTVRGKTLMVALLALALGGCGVLTNFGDNGGWSAPEPIDPFDYGEGKDPTTKTLHSVARLHASQGDDKQAEVMLNAVLSEDPAFLPAYTDLAELYLRKSMTSTAISVLEAGLKHEPTDPVLLNDLGVCHLMEREFELALHYFTAAAANAPTDFRSRGNMAVALGMLGRDQEAVSLYEMYLPVEGAEYNVGVLKQARKLRMTPVRRTYGTPN
jgi:tetratricopeptide (TPR) repeat protein